MTKDNGNKGRKFWTCQNKMCNFFQWFDGPSNVGASGSSSAGSSTFGSGSRVNSRVDSSAAAKRPVNSGASGANGAGGQRQCQCGLEVTVRETTQGANMGRKYLSCPKPRESKCGYFEWADEVDSSAHPKRSFSGAGGGGGGSNGGCFQCGEEGHWASGVFDSLLFALSVAESMNSLSE